MRAITIIFNYDISYTCYHFELKKLVSLLNKQFLPKNMPFFDYCTRHRRCNTYSGIQKILFVSAKKGRKN